MISNSFTPYTKKRVRKRYRNEVPRLRSFSPPKNTELKYRSKFQEEKVPPKTQR